MIKFKEEQDIFYNCYKNAQKGSKSILLVGLVMVKNQEKNILETINSIKKICDSIIIVDTGSTDETIKVVNKISGKITIEKIVWEENYAKMRNRCLKFVPSNAWVLFIDADEKLITDCDYTELRTFLASLDMNYPKKDKVCTVRQLQPDRPAFTRVERFIKKTDSLFYYGYAHEEPRSKSKTKLLKIDTDIEILNKGLTLDEISKFDKEKRYAYLLLKNLENEPDNPRWISLISLSFINRGYINHNEYHKLLREAILKTTTKEVSTNNVKKGVYLSYLLERYCSELIQKNELNLAQKYIDVAKKLFPFDVNFLVFDTTIFFIRVRNESKKRLSDIILFTRKEDNEVIDSESEGTEEALTGTVIKLLLQLENYEEAKKLFSTLSDPVVKLMLKTEEDILK